MSLDLRPIGDDDLDFLWRMLTFAASMVDAGNPSSVAAAKADGYLAQYVVGWGRQGDTGVVALRGGERIGAAWLRLGDGVASPFKVATATEPELAIAVAPDHRGRGVGRALLEAVLAVGAASGIAGVVLSVRPENPSVRLYERVGFTVQTRIENRVGGDSLVMRWRPPPPTR